MLDRIPPELLDRIILLCDPIDIATLSQLNHLFHHHINRNDELWHRIFIRNFDDPSKLEPDIRSTFESHPSTVRHTCQPDQIDWRSTLTSRIVLRQMLREFRTAQPPFFIHRLQQRYPANRLESLYHLLLLILYTARPPSYTAYPNPLHTTLNTIHSRNLVFLHDLLSNRFAQLHLFQIPGTHSGETETRVYNDMDDLVARFNPAKLHTLFGLTDIDLNSIRTRCLARVGCYSVDNTTPHNLYGPFVRHQSTRVNWCHLRDLFLVVAFNLYDINYRECNFLEQRPHSNYCPPILLSSAPPFTMPDDDEDPNPTPPEVIEQPNPLVKYETPEWPLLETLQSAIPFTQPAHPKLLNPPSTNPREDLIRQDWAGVTGKWFRVVCFLDYTLFHAFNFGIKVKLDHETESVRSMTLNLEVASIGRPPNASHPIPVDLRTDLPHRPPIFFEGKLTYNVGASTEPSAGRVPFTLRGCVSMTLDGEVRWSIVSALRGRDAWSSEGIQVGGVQSKWGVLGIWTDVNRQDFHAPVGPFYFFKTSV